MIWRLYQDRDILPAFVASGCPKHGLHLLALMVEGVAEKHPASIYNSNHWHGTYMFDSFTLNQQPMERWFFLMSRVQQGYYVQGHLGHRQDVADFLRLSRAAHVFIYRDLRDVAVSMVHHALDDDNDRCKHPAKGMYRAIRDQQGEGAVLSAIIEGIGPFPGVVKLWEAYAGWLDEEATHAVKYEDALADPVSVAGGILEYGLGQVTRDIWEVEHRVERSLFDQAVERMAGLSKRTDLSPTFRKGKAGGWRDVFEEHHKYLFKQQDHHGWLVRLGYEDNNDW